MSVRELPGLCDASSLKLSSLVGVNWAKDKRRWRKVLQFEKPYTCGKLEQMTTNLRPKI